jgi:NO-binding membrane sensor protein with MHYT domain
MDINDPNWRSPDIAYWPWAVVIGWPLAFAFWFFGRRAASSFVARAILSLLVACAIAPTIMNYGGRSAFVYAIGMLRRVFSSDASERWTGIIAATPPIFVAALFVFTVWTFTRRQSHAA